ncbi:MAG TPA: sigma-70 family RNA polymerase sigma factor [Epulopiscium sp.]|nr:sigma-70 family RNA polymerase sigma factor [Candidatus Epulonipiscium sp.]
MEIEQEKLLVEKAKNGDMDAFEQLVIANEKIVYNIIYRIVNNPEDTYDLSQETFIKAYTKLHQFNQESKFSTWLYRIATNTSLDELRRRKGKETFSMDQTMQGQENEMTTQYIDEDANVEEKILEKENADIIESALKELSEDHKVVLMLRDMQNLSYEEIAGILEITLGTVKSRISRARREMKNIIMQDKEPYASYFRQNDIRRDRHGL